MQRIRRYSLIAMATLISTAALAATVNFDDAKPGVAAYPVCYKNDEKIKNGFVEVKFKAISGKEDQAGGVVWRLKDADNYYVARANALEDNVTIYDTVNG